MKRLCVCLLALPVLCALAVPQTQRSRHKKTDGGTVATGGNGSFTLSCGSPQFPSSATPADSGCGVTGSGGPEANQNSAKNNFCAAGDPETLTFDELKKMQTQVANKKNIAWGNKNTAIHKKGPTVDRAPLQQIGEGKLVAVNGFVLIARQEGAESVNCGHTAPNEPVYHDIHISIVPSANESNECSGIVAEMSPHHRPAEWTAENVNSLAKKHHPVRVVGNLFFDSSHVPCENGVGVPSNPKRFSLWEVHPIYKLEVCATGNCANGGWTEFSDWVKNGRE
jgi:hypothetical protein